MNWADELNPYIKSSNIYICPSDPTIGTPNAFYINGWLSGIVMSYAINANFGADGSTNAPPAPMSMAKFTAPGATVLLCEITGFGHGSLADNTQGALSTRGNGSFCLPSGDCGTPTSTWGVLFATGYFSNTPSSQYGVFAAKPAHNRGSNYAFADGHVKWLNGSSVSEGYSNPSAGGCANASYGLAQNTSAGNCTSPPAVSATFSVS